VIAALLPVLTAGFGGWIFFAWTAARRRNWRLAAAGAGYLTEFVAAIVVLDQDPTSSDGVAEGGPYAAAGTLMLIIGILGASVHGAIVAARPWHTPHQRQLREQAQMLARTNPAEARQLGIGRPDLPRWFDDGGLVDINHAPAHELAKVHGLTPLIAHRIAVDRIQRGPYLTVQDLLPRGMLSEAAVRALHDRLVAVPPARPGRPGFPGSPPAFPGSPPAFPDSSSAFPGSPPA
jgi:hypothetical protein